MNTRILFSVLIVFPGFVGPVSAHHSFSGQNAVDQIVTIDGDIQDVTFSQCDPDSFYRTMCHDDVLQEFFEIQPEPFE